MNLPDSHHSTQIGRETLSVSQLNQLVKNTLQKNFSAVSVSGEIANFSRPLSGHVYFTLKDNFSQLRCVLFRTYQSTDYINLLKDGVAVELVGQITLYCQNGQYQMIVSSLTLQGDGLLKQQFLALKKRLESQGFFDIANKRPLPKYPKTIGIISSPLAAGLEDFITTLKKRFPVCHVRLFSSSVQGNYASEQLISALHLAKKDANVDVIVFCRGGGSMEDLWCFNNEALAQAIFECKKPIVSAIGHEKDFTICDLSADVRAATPTAAAIMVAPDIHDLESHIVHQNKQALNLIKNLIAQKKISTQNLSSKICHPLTKIHAYLLELQKINKNLLFSILKIQNGTKSQLQFLQSRTSPTLLFNVVQHADMTLCNISTRLQQFVISYIGYKKSLMCKIQSQLNALNPTNVLKRGYGIVKHNGKIVHSLKKIKLKDTLSISLHDGSILVEVLDLE